MNYVAVFVITNAGPGINFLIDPFVAKGDEVAAKKCRRRQHQLDREKKRYKMRHLIDRLENKDRGHEVHVLRQ